MANINNVPISNPNTTTYSTITCPALPGLRHAHPAGDCKRTFINILIYTKNVKKLYLLRLKHRVGQTGRRRREKMKRKTWLSMLAVGICAALTALGALLTCPKCGYEQ